MRSASVCEEKINKGEVYLATNQINNKKYVGMTTRPLNVRVSEHKYDSVNRLCNNRSYFHNAIRKYGIDNFQFETLEILYDKDIAVLHKKLCEAEQYYINKFSTNIKDVGYNLTIGGDGVCGYSLSQEHKDLISKIHKGKKLSDEHKRRISEFMRSDKNPNKGRKMPEETREKIRRSLTGKMVGEKNPMFGVRRPEIAEYGKARAKNIVQLHLDTNEYIRTWQSAREIERVLGIDRCCVRDCCKHVTKKSHGFNWMYLTEYQELKEANDGKG